MRKIQTILVATDFAPPADGALEFALDLAEELGASIALVHAYEIPIYGFPDAAFVAAPGFAQKLLDQATASLDATVARCAGRGVHIESYVREGSPWDVINEVTETVGAGLVVVGTHGRHGFAHALLGSVAEHIVRVATVPVVTVRMQEPATGIRHTELAAAANG
jgi:nucleotide-binding universal stress UspA family protein